MHFQWEHAWPSVRHIISQQSWLQRTTYRKLETAYCESSGRASDDVMWVQVRQTTRKHLSRCYANSQVPHGISAQTISWRMNVHTCSPVVVRKFCVILSWWLSSCRRCSWATTTLYREPNMRHYPDPQHLWWQSFCSCRSWGMEQITATSRRCWFTVQSVPAVTKDIFVWIVGPRHSVNYFICAV